MSELLTPEFNFFNFYRAKVENNVGDPENRNRVQIRVLGLHSQLNDIHPNDGIPTEHLPWAEQAAPIFGGFSKAGVGISTIPQIGSWLWIFFDAGDHNRPVYFASIPGNNDTFNADAAQTIVMTISGHTIRIDDDAETNLGTIAITTRNGNSIILQDNTDNDKENEVIIHAKNTVRLDADLVVLGPNGNFLVTSPPSADGEPYSIVTHDGHTLTATPAAQA